MRALFLLVLAACGAGVAPGHFDAGVDTNPGGICALESGLTEWQVSDRVGPPCQSWEDAGAAEWLYASPKCPGLEPTLDVYYVRFDRDGRLVSVLDTVNYPNCP